MARQKKRMYALYSLIVTLFEEAVLAAAVLLFLPRFGVNISVWLLALLMVAWAVYSYITFRLGERVIGLAPRVGPETLVSACGTTITP